MLSNKWTAILVALAATIAGVTHNILSAVRPFKPALPVNDSSNCYTTKGPWGAEDIVLGQNGWVFTSSLDGSRLFESGVTVGCRDGGIWAFQLKIPHPTVVMVPLWRSARNKPSHMIDTRYCPHTHGMYLSNSTNRLYVITHYGYSSQIEVFDIEYEPENKAPPTLTWVRAVASSSFPNMGINDVVEGASKDELYVTQFLPSFASVPHGGRKHPANFNEWIGQALLVPSFLLGLRLTTVQYCKFSDDPDKPAQCQPQRNLKFLAANGITITDDRNTVYVNDVLGYKIVEAKRQTDGTLQPSGVTIPLTHAVDNIEWKLHAGREEIWMGTIESIITLVQNERVPYEKRAVVPGGLARVVKDDSDGHPGTWSEQQIAYHHDGRTLSQISSGFSHDGKSYMGSAYARGVLICRNEEDS